LDAALATARNFARFALCGMISDYNGAGAAPQNLLMAIEKRLLLQGFLVSDYLASRPAFIQQMNQWIASGDSRQRLRVKTRPRYGIHRERIQA
jgi:NADPH-dependent curcumin reductase CurA